MAPEERFAAEFASITAVIDRHRRFLVAGHVDPDGDCIGSMLAVALHLKAWGREVHCFVPGEVPRVFGRLPGMELFVDAAGLADCQFEVIFALDAPTAARTEVITGRSGRSRIVNIDHHPTNERYGEINVVDGGAAATAVLIHRYLAAEAPEQITADMADCLYVGILMDTGGFRFQNTDPEALRTAARLVELGAHPYELANTFIYMNTVAALRLLGLALGSLEIHGGGKIAVMSVTREMLLRAGASLAETEGFVDYAASIDRVELCALLREVGPREVRVSLRSRGSLDVADLAERYGGGGHRKAAGLTIQAAIGEANSIVIGELEALLGERDSPAAS